ncbi:hypothetical protein FRC00_003982, partial [Tulasnella sp. 408]
MQFKRDAARWKKEIRELENTVFEVVQENMVRVPGLQLRAYTQRNLIAIKLADDPEVRSSFMFKRAQELHNKHEGGQDLQQRREDEIALAYSGLQIFSVQEKARAEIDRVVGSDRFPTFHDQLELPFLHAAILEILRWNPVASF